MMAATIAVGAPLLARELGRLGRETPSMLRTARRDWLPAIDRTVRGFSSSLATPETDEPAPDPSDDAPLEEAPLEGDEPLDAPVEAPVHLEVRPRPDGSYEVILPRDGISIEPRDGGGFVVRTEENADEDDPRDLSVQITEALRRQMREGEQTAGDALRTAQSLVAAVVNGIFKFFIMLMISAYMLITKDGIHGFFRTLVSAPQRASFDLLLDRIDKGLSGVVRGQLVICLVNGVLSGVGFYIADLNYWPVLTLVATVLSIIPIFGAILSSIPAVIVGLQHGVGTALFTLAWIIGIHQLEANLLNPKIMGDAAKVHPVLVVFSLIAGEHFFGILGALLAVPVLSISQSLFLHFREVALGVPASSTISGLPRAASSSSSGATEAPKSQAADPKDAAASAQAPTPSSDGEG
jgi:hypothetical protein